MGERFVVERVGCDLAGEPWRGNAQLVVLLREGVSDRRGWREVAQRLAPRVTAVAYDRRGYGESAVSTAPFTRATGFPGDGGAGVGDAIALFGAFGATSVGACEATTWAVHNIDEPITATPTVFPNPT